MRLVVRADDAEREHRREEEWDEHGAQRKQRQLPLVLMRPGLWLAVHGRI
jgi:hypothetical protein